VKVNREGGDIKPGDQIAVSSVPGVGKRSAGLETTIGIALERFDQSSAADEGGIGKITMFIDLSYRRLSSAINGDALASGVYWQLDETTGQLKSFAALDLAGQNIENAGAIMSASGQWSISADGILTTKEVRTEKLCLGSVCVDENDLRSLLEMAGIGITEVITGGGDNNDNNNDNNGTTTDDATATTTPLVEDEPEEPPVEEPDSEPASPEVSPLESEPEGDSSGDNEPEPEPAPEPIPEPTPEPIPEPSADSGSGE